MLKNLLLSLVLLITVAGFAQKGIIKGQVIGKNQPVPFANISIKGTKTGAISDSLGNFQLENVSYGKHILQISSSEFHTKNTEVVVDQPIVTLQSIELESNTLEEIVVSKSKIKMIKEQPFAVDVIDIKPLQNLDLNLNTVLNQSTGIRIRESGGLGSDFQFSLNGFTGNQVRFFVDGLPTSALGSAYSINAVPVNNVDRIDIYKGVVPVNLGSDALGGAINFVTNNATRSFLDVSYSRGSFNTHRASLVGRYTTKKNFVVNTSFFYNYSDNDFNIKVNLINKQTGKIDSVPTEVRRFNDGFKSVTGNVEFGVINKKYADRLFVGIIGSATYKEFQNALEISKPSGEVHRTENGFIPTLKYEKKDLFTKGLSFRLNAVYSKNESRNVDTSSKTYDWFGNWVYQPLSATSGELAWYATLFTFTDKSLLNTATLEYELGKHHTFTFNNTYSHVSRIGTDPVAQSPVPFNEPNILKKNFSGLSYQLKVLDNRLRTNVFGKLFDMDSRQYENSGDSLRLVHQKYICPGYGIATSFFLLSYLQLKASYEDTYRLPEAGEMYGDGLLVLPNPNLEPERSKNLNTGILFGKRFGKHLINSEFNYLYRLPNNLIRTVAYGVLSVNENLANGKISCYEGAISYGFKEVLKIEVNGAYQNMRNTSLTETGEKDYLYGDRLPNIPFLFGNASVMLNSKSFGKLKHRMSMYYSVNYVEEFYLRWPSQGSASSKYIIPTQIAHNLSISYTSFEGSYNLTFSCLNLFDDELYDNFRVQKPGRSFSVKLRYFIKPPQKK